MTCTHLHSVIREANGAYGGGLSYDGVGGTCALDYYSYRDPAKSASAFGTSAQAAQGYLTEGKWDKKAFQEAKSAIFRSVDAPAISPVKGSRFSSMVSATT